MGNNMNNIYKKNIIRKAINDWWNDVARKIEFHHDPDNRDQLFNELTDKIYEKMITELPKLKCDWCGKTIDSVVDKIILDKKEFIDTYTKISAKIYVSAEITVNRSYSPNGYICMDCLKEVMIKWILKG